MKIGVLLIFILVVSFFQKGKASLDISGATRTKTEYIEFLYQSCVRERDLDNESEDFSSEIQQCLQNSKLFTKVEVSQEDEKTIIRVEDRWTLLPLPLIRVEGEGNTKYGILLLDSNFLGWGKLLGISVDTSTKGSSGYSLFYRDRDFFLTQWSLSAQVSRLINSYRSFEANRYVSGYTEEKDLQMLQAGYSFNKKWNLGMGLYQKKMVSTQLDPYILSFKKYQNKGIRWQIQWDASNFFYYAETGWKWKLSWEQDFDLNTEVGDNVGSRNVTSTLDFAGLLLMDHVVLAQIQWGQEYQATTYDGSFKLGYRKGFRGVYSGDIWADKYAAIALDYLIPVKNSRRMTWTLGGFVDAGSYSDVSFSAVGISVYSFLKNVALPGVGFEMGTNSYFRNSFVTFSVGVMF